MHFDTVRPSVAIASDSIPVRVRDFLRASTLRPEPLETSSVCIMQWIEEEIVEEAKEGAGVDPAKFAASLKSDDDAMSDAGSLGATSRTDSNSLSDKSGTKAEEDTDELDKVRSPMGQVGHWCLAPRTEPPFETLTRTTFIFYAANRGLAPEANFGHQTM